MKASLMKILSGKKAMTMIELVMVITIIGILAVISIPRFDVLYDIKLQGAAKEMVADIRFVQNVAISKHTDTRVQFNTGLDRYSAEYYDSGSSLWVAIKDPFTRYDLLVDFNDDPQYTGVDLNNVDFGGTNTLRFNWQGFPQSGTGVTLVSDGTFRLSFKGDSVTVNITPQTGKVTAQ